MRTSCEHKLTHLGNIADIHIVVIARPGLMPHQLLAIRRHVHKTLLVLGNKCGDRMKSGAKAKEEKETKEKQKQETERG